MSTSKNSETLEKWGFLVDRKWNLVKQENRMIIKDGKIIECTDDELFEYWIRRFDDIYMYETFKQACIMHGTKVID